MPVANSQRCEYVDPETGKRCGRRATYLNSEGQWCEGFGHDPAYPEDEVNEDEEIVEMEIDDQIPDDFEAAIVEGILKEELDREPTREEFDAVIDLMDRVLPKTKPEDPSRYCACGCGEPVAKGRIYEQGHDQRHKGILMRAAVRGDDKAMETLIQKGWRTRENVLTKRQAEQAKQERKIAKQLGKQTPKTEIVMEFEPR